MGDKCQICDAKVYLLERLIDNGQLYHRTCFRQNEKSPASKIYQRPNVVTQEKKDSNNSNFWERRNKEGEKTKASNLMSKINSLERPQKKPTIVNTAPKENISEKSRPSDLDWSSNKNGTKQIESTSNFIKKPSIMPQKNEEKMETDLPPFKPMAKPRGGVKKQLELSPRIDAPPLPSSKPPEISKDSGSTSPMHISPRTKRTVLSDTQKPDNEKLVSPKNKSPQRPSSGNAIGGSNSTTKDLKTGSRNVGPNTGTVTPGPKQIGAKYPPVDTGPMKPPRNIHDRTSKPLTTDEAIAVSDRLSNKNETVAVLVSPVSPPPDSSKDKQVLNSLLKNLAHIKKTKNNSEDTNKPANQTSVPSPKSSETKKVNDKHEPVKQGGILDKLLPKKSQNDKKSEKSPKLSPKFGRNSPSPKPTQQTSEPEIPEWKKRLEDNKKKLQQRVENDNKKPVIPSVQNGSKNDSSKNQLSVNKAKPQRPKTPEVISKSHVEDSKPEWQMEAEKRKLARKGEYKDPEFAFKDKAADANRKNTNASPEPPKTTQPSDITKPNSGLKPKRVLPTIPFNDKVGPGHNTKTNIPGENVLVTKDTTPGKKKIPLGMKFDFNSDSKKVSHDISKPKSPPTRPPLPSPTGYNVGSMKKQNYGSPKRQPTLEVNYFIGKFLLALIFNSI